MRHQSKVGALIALAGHPDEIGQDRVNLARLQRHLAGTAVGNIAHFDLDVVILVQARRMHRGNLPGRSAALLQRQA